MRITLPFLASILLSSTLNAAKFISPSDTGILYTGRWDKSNVTEPWAFAKGTSTPVFHTRLTFQAAEGSTIDIDDVAMQVESIGCDDPACQIPECTASGVSCMNNQDCCSGSCSKGKPSTRVCL